MKYLKKIFESKAVSSEDIREFCEGYLYYLYDEGFEMDITKIAGNIFRMELVKKDKNVRHYRICNFNWIDIKDTIIPFLQVLHDEYKITEEIEFDQMTLNIPTKLNILEPHTTNEKRELSIYTLENFDMNNIYKIEIVILT